MNAANYADALYGDIVSGNFEAFQKRLHEIAEDRSLLRKVLAYNLMGFESDRYTLVQSATVYALETGNAEMLMALIRLDAPTTWQTGLPRPMLIRQHAVHASAEFFAHMEEDCEEYMECADSYVADTDSVDESFERALEGGNPHAAQIREELLVVWHNQLTNAVEGVIHRDESLNFISTILHQYIAPGLTDLVQFTTNEPALDHTNSKPSTSTNKPF